jgi:hypothetical protein
VRYGQITANRKVSAPQKLDRPCLTAQGLAMAPERVVDRLVEHSLERESQRSRMKLNCKLLMAKNKSSKRIHHGEPN